MFDDMRFGGTSHQLSGGHLSGGRKSRRSQRPARVVATLRARGPGSLREQQIMVGFRLRRLDDL